MQCNCGARPWLDAFNGEGVPKDRKGAAKWCRLAADKGDANAHKNLGAMCRYGDGVVKNNLLACMWEITAEASGGDAGALRAALTDEMSQTDIAKAQEFSMAYINLILI